jgi:hypothetical protein
MKMPEVCPFCKGTLLNEYIDPMAGSTYIRKICDKNITHNITFVSFNNQHDLVSYFYINYKSSRFEWSYKSKELCFYYPFILSKKETLLPWFEPDLSNYNKLINKVKTYLTFS